jgi:hypothetical protein
MINNNDIVSDVDDKVNEEDSLQPTTTNVGSTF